MRTLDDGSVLLEQDENPGTHSGMNACLLRVMGVPILLCGLGLVVLSFMGGEPGFMTGIGLVMLLFSVLMFTGANNQHRIDLRSTLCFDPNTERLSVYKRTAARALAIPFSEFSGLLVRREALAPSEEAHRRYEYRAYLELADGATIWLTSAGQKERMGAVLAELHALLGLAVRDQADCGLERAATRTWEPRADAGVECAPSRFVQRIDEAGIMRFQLLHEEPLNAKILQVAIWSFFLLIPSLIALQVLGAALSDPSGGSLLALVIFTPFLAFFLAILALIFASTYRDYRVTLFEDEVFVEVFFRLDVLQKRLGKDFRIPRDAVRKVRVHREASGDLTLDMVHEGEATVNDASSLFREGVFAPTTHAGPASRPLWRFLRGTPEGTGPDFGDAAYLLQVLRDELRVTDPS